MNDATHALWLFAPRYTLLPASRSVSQRRTTKGHRPSDGGQVPHPVQRHSQPRCDKRCLAMGQRLPRPDGQAPLTPEHVLAADHASAGAGPVGPLPVRQGGHPKACREIVFSADPPLPSVLVREPVGIFDLAGLTRIADRAEVVEQKPQTIIDQNLFHGVRRQNESKPHKSCRPQAARPPHNPLT